MILNQFFLVNQNMQCIRGPVIFSDSKSHNQWSLIPKCICSVNDSCSESKTDNANQFFANCALFCKLRTLLNQFLQMNHETNSVPGLFSFPNKWLLGIGCFKWNRNIPCAQCTWFLNKLLLWTSSLKWIRTYSEYSSTISAQKERLRCGLIPDSKPAQWSDFQTKD